MWCVCGDDVVCVVFDCVDFVWLSFCVCYVVLFDVYEWFCGVNVWCVCGDGDVLVCEY